MALAERIGASCCMARESGAKTGGARIEAE
jgi:hypothetical protein